MILKYYNEESSCDKAVKGPDYIICYQDDSVVAQFNGISDFAGYALTDDKGDPVPFHEPEPDEVTRLQLALTELYEEVLSRG